VVIVNFQIAPFGFPGGYNLVELEKDYMFSQHWGAGDLNA
jgi:hypothetical protein